MSVDDTLGTGAEICLFVCLLVTPFSMLTGQRWFVPLRRWYGIVMAVTAFGDALAAGITDNFAGGVFGQLAGHVFELMGFMMVMLVIPIADHEQPRGRSASSASTGSRCSGSPTPSGGCSPST